MSYTKGEWAWQKFGSQYMLTAQHGMREIIIGTCRDKENTMTHQVATNIDGILQPITPDIPNAKLIAAAPDLFDALEKAIPFIAKQAADKESKITERLLSRMMNAIKKATA